MFRVVPDQLRISGGWVRCGNCEEVFDANARLRPTTAQNAALSPAPDAGSVPAPSASPPVPTEPAPPPPLPAANLPPSNSVAPEPEPAPQSVPVQSPQVPPVAAEVAQPVADPFLQLRPREQAAMDPAGVAEELNVSALGGTVVTADSPRYVQAVPAKSDPPAYADLSFMRKPGHGASFWSRPLGRWLVRGICVLAALGLGLQIVLNERDRIAATVPGAQPVVSLLCEVAGCTVNAVRQIEFVQIDGSSLSKVRTGAYRLSFTLRNGGEIAIATPAIELTLTDAQDQVVLRRVLTAGEFSGWQLRIAADGELAVAVPVAIQTDGALEKFAGYRLLAFYP